MLDNSRLRRIFLNSPFFLLVFAVLPALLILSRFLQLRLPFHFTTKMILANIICLLLLLAVRLVRYLSVLRSDIRYDDGLRRPSAARDLLRPASVVRADMERGGYRFTDDGAYAEKADLGYPGTVLVYAGLVLLLGIGTWDNLAQFSGTFIHGIGKAAPLDRSEIYYPLIPGPFSSVAGLPKLEITQLNFTDTKHPKGTVEIILWSKENKPLGQAVLEVTGEPYRYRGYDIFVSKLLIDAGLSIKTRDKNNSEVIIFKDAVKLSPLWKKEGDYSFYGTFTDRAGLDGELLYSPEKNLFKVMMNRDGKKVLETEYPFQVVLNKVVGDYDLSFIAVGRWAEIHVVRRRHMAILWVGGIIAALGLIMRIAFRPQRLWLEETAEGCRVWVVGGKTKKLIFKPEEFDVA